MSNFNGLGVALITPFNTDKSINYTKLANLIDFQIEGGVDYIVALGTTAETPTLSIDERHNVRDFIVDHVNGRVPIVAGCGGNSTFDVIDELSHGDFSGISGVLSVAPFYNKPSQRGIYSHFADIAEASPVPVILYNVPGRTGVNIAPDTVVSLANNIKNIVAIKEASGNVAQINRLLATKPEGFDVISGDDSLTLPLMAIGCSGVISVAANAVPRLMKVMVSLAANNDFARAMNIHRELTPLFTSLFADGNPSGIKALLSILGLIDNSLRLPLVPVSDEIHQQIDKAYANLNR